MYCKSTQTEKYTKHLKCTNEVKMYLKSRIVLNLATLCIVQKKGRAQTQNNDFLNAFRSECPLLLYTWHYKTYTRNCNHNISRKLLFPLKVTTQSYSWGLPFFAGLYVIIKREYFFFKLSLPVIYNRTKLLFLFVL